MVCNWIHNRYCETRKSVTKKINKGTSNSKKFNADARRLKNTVLSHLHINYTSFSYIWQFAWEHYSRARLHAICMHPQDMSYFQCFFLLFIDFFLVSDCVHEDWTNVGKCGRVKYSQHKQKASRNFLFEDEKIYGGGLLSRPFWHDT